MRIVAQDVPNFLINTVIYVLDLALLEAGSSLRGEFEKRLKDLVTHIQKDERNIILFIDEADAFLRSRKGSDISEYMRHSINSFLYRTGTPSERVILVMATNNPEQLDEAIHDRIDEVVGFNKPNENERRIMLFHYLV